MASAEDLPQNTHQPYVPDEANLPEFTWSAVLVGAFLGIIFGASSLYLVLKVGMTVSASVPIAVLSITLFRGFSQLTGFRRASILENNIVQTTGSAGESIAFGVGVTMPTLLLLGFEMDVVRIMTVAVLGGLLGILMMIPLRRAFIVKQHDTLKYPEGTACAEVLIAGEKGGATARMVFFGFGIALVHKFMTAASHFWPETPSENLYSTDSEGTKEGLKGASIGGELSPELLGVGFLIGPKIASMMLAGAFLSYLVLGPIIATFGDKLAVAVSPAKEELIRDMDPGDLQKMYLRYIGAGAVAAGGIISMCRALPLIVSSIVSGLRDLRTTGNGEVKAARRTERDMSMAVVVFGSIGMVVAIMLTPALGLGFTVTGFVGALMILVFGFLFVTVSSRLTGEIGSSSNPISGMTIATLLLTCLIFLFAGMTGHGAMLTALTVSAVVCIASSNAGTTSQDLKTGYLVGATPRSQQYGILVGALTSALVIGVTMLALNAISTYYADVSKTPAAKAKLAVPGDAPSTRVGTPYADDEAEYRVVHVTKKEAEIIQAEQKVDIKPGRYLVKVGPDSLGSPQYLTEIPLGRKEGAKMGPDNNLDAPRGFAAPQPELFASIIQGILGGELEWSLFGIGALIAISMELAGVRSLPFAVGMYLPISLSTTIFAGGMLRWLLDTMRGVSASEAETETSPGALMASGYIAGGTVFGLIIAFFTQMPDAFNSAIDVAHRFGAASIASVDQKQIDEFKSEISSIKATAEAEEKKATSDAAKEAIARKAKYAVKYARAQQPREAGAVDVAVAIDKGKGQEAKAANEEQKLAAASNTEKGVESLRRDLWLESGLAKVLALIAFGVLAAFLFWQGLQKPPPDPTAPPPGQPDTRIQA